MKLPLVGPHSLGRFPQLNARRAVNFLVEAGDGTGKDALVWVLRPGLKAFCNTAAVVRGMIFHGGYIWAVAADKLYRIDESGTVSAAMATLTSDTTASYPYVSMAATLRQIAIADGSMELFNYVPETAVFTTVSAFSEEHGIASVTRTAGSTTATVTTQTDHNGNTGKQVSIAGASYAPNTSDYYNGLFTMTRTGATTFTVTLTGKSIALTGDGATATATTTTAHQLNTGDSVDIVSSTVAGYNANGVTVTKTSATTFTYANVTTGAATAKVLPPYPDPVAAGIATVQVRSDPLTFRPSRLTSMDGYIISDNRRYWPDDGVDWGQFYVSEAEDATTWDAAMVGSAQREYDALIRPWAQGGQLFLIGETSTETYYNSGASDFPFEPVRAAAGPWGCAAPYTVAEVGDGLMWVGQRKNGQVTVVKMEGYRPSVVATEAVAWWLDAATTAQLAAATAMSFRWLEHDLYVLTCADQTWAYDATATAALGKPVWTRWTSPVSGVAGAWRGRFHAYAWGRHFVSDRAAAKILEVDQATYTDLDGTAASFEKIGVSGYVLADDKAVYHHRVHIDFANTTGTATVLLESSDDGGSTWASHGSVSLASGDNRAEWHSLGLARTDRAYRVTVTGDVGFAIIGAWLDLEAGDR